MSLLLLHMITLLGIIQSHVFVYYKLPKALLLRMTHLVVVMQELSPRPPNSPNLSLGRTPTRVSAGASHLRRTEILSPWRCRTIAWSTQYNKRMQALSTVWKARATGASGWRVWGWRCRGAPSVIRVPSSILTIQKRSSRTWSTWAWARKGSNPPRKCCVRPLLSSTEASASLKATGDLSVPSSLKISPMMINQNQCSFFSPFLVPSVALGRTHDNLVISLQYWWATIMGSHIVHFTSVRGHGPIRLELMFVATLALLGLQTDRRVENIILIGTQNIQSVQEDCIMLVWVITWTDSKIL